MYPQCIYWCIKCGCHWRLFKRYCAHLFFIGHKSVCFEASHVKPRNLDVCFHETMFMIKFEMIWWSLSEIGGDLKCMLLNLHQIENHSFSTFLIVHFPLVLPKTNFIEGLLRQVGCGSQFPLISFWGYRDDPIDYHDKTKEHSLSLSLLLVHTLLRLLPC